MILIVSEDVVRTRLARVADLFGPNRVYARIDRVQGRPKIGAREMLRRMATDVDTEAYRTVAVIVEDGEAAVREGVTQISDGARWTTLVRLIESMGATVDAGEGM